MGRNAPRRRGLAAAVSAFAVAVAAATIAVLPQHDASADPAAPAANASEITLTDPADTQPRADRPLVAGASGFLHRQTGITGLLWTDYADGTSTVVRTADGVYAPAGVCASLGSSTCPTAWYGSDADLVALPSSGSVALWDPATRTTSSFTSDEGYRGLAGRTVVTEESLHDLVDGTWRSRAITPDWVRITSGAITAADRHGALFKVDSYLYYLDLATATATQVFSGMDARPYTVLSDDRIGWYDPAGGNLHVKPRTDPEAAEQVIDLPTPGAQLDGTPVLSGDRLLLPLHTGTGTSALRADSLLDGSSRTLAAEAGAYIVRASGGTALVTGGTGASDWWVRRFAQAGDGTPGLQQLAQIPAAENAKTGLALSRGSLRVAEDDPSGTMDTTSLRTLAVVGGQLTASAPGAGDKVLTRCPYTGVACSVLWGNLGNNPRDAFLGTTDTGLTGKDRLVAMLDGSSDWTLEFGTTGGHIVDVSDNYAVYDSGGASPEQYIGEFGQGQKLKRSVRAAALNGSTLWSASTTGKLTSYSLPEDKTLATVTVPGMTCVPGELQAAGRWVYWACGDGSAGVYDTKASTSRAVSGGDELLGDGFTVRHDRAAGTLVLTDAATGTSRVLATDVADTGLAMDRRFKWTVDEYTGLVAWTDLYERTHIARTGVTPSAVTAFRPEATDFVGSNTPFHGSWLLSRPVTSWSVTFASVQSGARGKATRTVGGGASTAWVATDWSGTTVDNARFPNGHFTWTLKATGIGTASAVTVATGKGFLQGGAPVRHDFAGAEGPDGRGDLLTLNSSGGLTFQSGTGTGKFGDKISGSGWATSIKAVPFGDLNGDRCNDVLVRLSSGALRAYKPHCGAAVTPKTSYTTLASSGWTQYDVLTSPGDVSGDGRPDLIARVASTGTVYVYKGTSTGTLSARVKLYDNWKSYKKIVGAGDLNGDGIGDLLAQDTSNTLFRYNGKGDGTFAARVKVFADWGGSYNAVVGVGDITDDGRADLVSRDTGGNLYRNSGDGKGSFGSRTKIATGWSGYRSIS
ncbi:FG-GAP repeat domain-containing protein [Streptomyces rhizosphaerihabitans]|uniref:FG-GAP repeat domain-containing protein n=1 Tax=Streptomyces rhizosphaerihabitans TaxID=1266770 RepID=UPI0021C1E920|nr:VCBS repeat-containing protein [Streptomyces rhizosphaerihabitans]MCT9008160.1 VCBS repeat-containing protein [Streptomyces rhizosphaerihabitans]